MLKIIYVLIISLLVTKTVNSEVKFNFNDNHCLKKNFCTRFNYETKNKFCSSYTSFYKILLDNKKINCNKVLDYENFYIRHNKTLNINDLSTILNNNFYEIFSIVKYLYEYNFKNIYALRIEKEFIGIINPTLRN